MSVLSGLFGMNFGWMIDRIDTVAAFVTFGIGGMLAAIGAAWLTCAGRAPDYCDSSRASVVSRSAGRSPLTASPRGSKPAAR